MNSCRPLFKKYPRQNEPQPAHIEIDETGAISADWRGGIFVRYLIYPRRSIQGDEVPGCVWHGRSVRLGISPHLTGSEIARLIDDIREDVVELFTVTEVVWNGSNHVRRARPDLRERFDAVIDRLTEICDDAETRADPCYEEDCEYCQFCQEG